MKDDASTSVCSSLKLNLGNFFLNILHDYNTFAYDRFNISFCPRVYNPRNQLNASIATSRNINRLPRILCLMFANKKK